ncbi:serine hydrolase domain-containing protein [Nocardia sp. SSK8]|uniref:serine hydrolase domain-containing protein n=1 Tax=Nocardia sp. SSK8 TaxID=3120154 RepID=UPI00300BB10E
MFRFPGRFSHSIMALSAISFLVVGGAGPARADDSGPGQIDAVVGATEFLAAVQGGKLLGVPPLPALAAGAAADYTSPEYWSNYVREVLSNNSILVPLPVDVIKPDVVLPHAPVAAGPDTSPLPAAPVDLRSVTYPWAGTTKTVEQYLHGTGTDAVAFVHNGAVVGEYFANGWSGETAHNGWSMTKSFVSTLVGIAVDQHLLASVADPVDKYIPELAGSAWQGVTIENLLTMRSGVHWDEHTEDLGENTQVLEWIDLALDYYTDGRSGQTRNEFLRSLPRAEPQGVHFNYNSANTQVLAWLLETVYQRPFNTVLSEQLWQPAGMEADADIMTDRTGAAVASQALFARPRDFARLGELMRNHGRTPAGKQVVSAEWVAAATTGMHPAEDAGDTEPGGYGYQWWNGVTPEGFQANGFQGQYITVSPSSCLTGLRLAHTLQVSTELEFGGQGKQEWHALYRAVLDRLGGCR